MPARNHIKILSVYPKTPAAPVHKEQSNETKEPAIVNFKEKPTEAPSSKID